MLLQAVYLCRAIHRYVEDLDEELSELQLSEEEWEKVGGFVGFLAIATIMIIRIKVAKPISTSSIKVNFNDLSKQDMNFVLVCF